MSDEFTLTPITVSLSEKTIARVVLLAAETGLSKGDVLAHAVHLASIVHEHGQNCRILLERPDGSGIEIKATCHYRFR